MNSNSGTNTAQGFNTELVEMRGKLKRYSDTLYMRMTDRIYTLHNSSASENNGVLCAVIKCLLERIEEILSIVETSDMKDKEQVIRLATLTREKLNRFMDEATRHTLLVQVMNGQKLSRVQEEIVRGYESDLENVDEFYRPLGAMKVNERSIDQVHGDLMGITGYVRSLLRIGRGLADNKLSREYSMYFLIQVVIKLMLLMYPLYNWSVKIVDFAIRPLIAMLKDSRLIRDEAKFDIANLRKFLMLEILKDVDDPFGICSEMMKEARLYEILDKHDNKIPKADIASTMRRLECVDLYHFDPRIIASKMICTQCHNPVSDPPTKCRCGELFYCSDRCREITNHKCESGYQFEGSTVQAMFSILEKNMKTGLGRDIHSMSRERRIRCAINESLDNLDKLQLDKTRQEQKFVIKELRDMLDLFKKMKFAIPAGVDLSEYDDGFEVISSDGDYNSRKEIKDLLRILPEFHGAENVEETLDRFLNGLFQGDGKIEEEEFLNETRLAFQDWESVGFPEVRKRLGITGQHTIDTIIGFDEKTISLSADDSVAVELGRMALGGGREEAGIDPDKRNVRPSKACANCGLSTTQKWRKCACDANPPLYYCEKKCQKAHWYKGHKETCSARKWKEVKEEPQDLMGAAYGPPRN